MQVAGVELLEDLATSRNTLMIIETCTMLRSVEQRLVGDVVGRDARMTCRARMMKAGPAVKAEARKRGPTMEEFQKGRPPRPT